MSTAAEASAVASLPERASVSRCAAGLTETATEWVAAPIVAVITG